MTISEILAAVKAGKITETEAETAIAALSGVTSTITYKVSEGKACLCAYGLQQRPVSLYVEQWERLDSPEERARRAAFIAANRSRLATKAQSVARKAAEAENQAAPAAKPQAEKSAADKVFEKLRKSAA